MTTQKIYPVVPAFAAQAHITDKQYWDMYHQSINDPENFWSYMAEQHLSWFKRWDKVSDCNYQEPRIQWFQGAELNASYNCIDRHLGENEHRTALIWEADDPSTPSQHITYRQLHDHVCKLANAMTRLGVQKGDRICIYMPMIPEAAYAMLACARIGAIHSVIFGGFSAESLKDRILDAEATFIITADEGRRGGKHVPLKATVNEALTKVPADLVRHVLVVRNTGGNVPMTTDRDRWYHEEIAHEKPVFEPTRMQATDPLFILYTSGSTGKPKGVVHGTGGYLLYATTTFKYVFDYKPDDIYWCTADVGWITGHSYIVYGPLSNGATVLMFEGVPNWPDPGRFWQIVDKHNVSILYTAPTAIRALHAQGDSWVTKHSRKSLRLLGSVGEPINPEAWEWYHNVIGDGRCPVVDTWWQTETGGILITPLAGATDLKPGSATRPFFGIQPVILDDQGTELHKEATGLLCIKASWPGQMQTVYNNHSRFRETYFTHFKGYYFTGDGCRRDADGYYWITGRVDDVLNVSGHRLGTAEIESALVLHDQVAEAAVVGYTRSL